jgi:hypothetical protein
MNRKLIFTIVLLIWAGMLAGISFLEAPVKFTAPSLTLRIGLDVGRQVFGVFNKVEMFFGTILLFFLIDASQPRSAKVLGLLTIVLLLIETFWFLPILDRRALAIINGQQPSGYSPHTLYIVFDVVKFICLVLTSYISLQNKQSQNQAIVKSLQVAE